jgi:hypothetical protein
MVSASYLPLLTLVLVRVAGPPHLPRPTSDWSQRPWSTLLLTVHAWLAGRSARLRDRQLLFASSFAAVLGLAMIVLKDVVLTHLH